MSLKKSCILAIIGILVLSLKNFYFTIADSISITTIVINLVLSLSAQIFIILFFLTLIKKFINTDDNQLMNASIGVITISTGLLVIDFVNEIGIIFDAYWLQDETLRYLHILINWLHAIIFAYFFYSFYLNFRKSSKYQSVTGLYGFIGSISTMIMKSIVLLNYFYSIEQNKVFLGKGSWGALPLGLLLIIISFSSWILFLTRLYKNDTRQPS